MDSSGLYLDVTEFAHDTPGWVQHLAEVWTELGLLLFGVLFVVAWWRARGGDPRAVAVAVLAPLGTALAYVISESVKSVIEEERPCRAVSGALRPLVECPPHGDWSFPSNHSTIAGAAALGLALAWPRVAALTLPMAVLMAFSRVFVGVHYPHDVAVGLVLGAVVVFLAVRLATRPVTRVTEAMRGSRTGVVRWFAGQGPATASAPAASAPAPAFTPSHDERYRNPLPYRQERAAAPGAGTHAAYTRTGHPRAGHAQDGYTRGANAQDDAYTQHAYAQPGRPRTDRPQPGQPRADHPQEQTMTLRQADHAQDQTMALRRIPEQHSPQPSPRPEPQASHQPRPEQARTPRPAQHQAPHQPQPQDPGHRP